MFIKLVEKFNTKFVSYTLLSVLSIAFFTVANKTMAFAPTVSVLEPSKVSTTQVTELSELVKNQYSNPTSVTIPSINVNSNVDHVGIEADGAMSTPVNFANVGWLLTSSKAGQVGNLIISGHYDYPGGAPAVFYNLTNVKTGDSVYVNYPLKSGSTVSQEYKITSMYLADPNNTDHIKQAFQKTNIPTITLITCNGIWDPIKQEYSHRVVVQGELVVNTQAKVPSQFIKNQFSN